MTIGNGSNELRINGNSLEKKMDLGLKEVGNSLSSSQKQHDDGGSKASTWKKATG